MVSTFLAGPEKNFQNAGLTCVDIFTISEPVNFSFGHAHFFGSLAKMARNDFHEDCVNNVRIYFELLKTCLPVKKGCLNTPFIESVQKQH